MRKFDSKRKDEITRTYFANVNKQPQKMCRIAFYLSTADVMIVPNLFQYTNKKKKKNIKKKKKY